MRSLGHLGMCCEAKDSTKIIIEYKNDNETTFRNTERTTRELVVVHKTADLDFNSRAHQEIMFTLSHFSLRFQKIEGTEMKSAVVY